MIIQQINIEGVMPLYGKIYIKMENKITYGLLGILSLIVAALGGTVFLTEDQLENAYVCSVNQNVVLGIDRLSSTSKTAYWYDELGEQKSKVCRNGFWLDLRQYAKDNNIELNILLQELNEKPILEVPVVVEGTKWLCSPERCVRI